MELQEIEVIIDENGETQIHIRGVKGMKCLDLTEDLEAALGGEIIERTLTPEAREPDTGLGNPSRIETSH
jgi:hypothetical protein